MAEPTHVALIDDDEAVLDSLRLYLERKGLKVSCFGSADRFLAARNRADPFDCIVADVRMPGMSGLDLVRHLGREPAIVPVILITGHGDIDMAVAAVKLGAFDFIEKPFNESRLLESIQHALDQIRREQQSSAELSELRERFHGLSERQRQVMDLAVQGLSNKEIAARLGISPRTVEIHRAWMMERIGARNLVDLIHIEMQLKGARR
jgi:two-component system response regulator FixJ